jgi:hypothetical protein
MVSPTANKLDDVEMTAEEKQNDIAHFKETLESEQIYHKESLKKPRDE